MFSAIDTHTFLELIDNAGDLVQSVSPEGRLLYVNQTWLDVLGYSPEEVKDLTVFDIISPACRNMCEEKFRMVLSSGLTHRVEAEFLAKDGRLIPIEGIARTHFQEGSPLATIGIFRDITDRLRAERERLRLEEHARTIEHLEAISRLAGGFAHHFNNLLMAVQGNIDLAKRHCADHQNALRHLDKAERAIDSAAHLSKEILAFANPEGKQKCIQLVELDSLVASLMEVLRGLVPASISIRHESIASPVTISADPQGLRTLVFHLVLNAGEAIGKRNGLITIRTSRISAQEAIGHEGYLFFGVLPAKKEYALLDVEDNGEGISPEVVQHIFEPFYTTKGPFRQGIGLSAAYRLVIDMGGAVAVRSSPGAGTTVRVLFPLHQAQ